MTQTVQVDPRWGTRRSGQEALAAFAPAAAAAMSVVEQAVWAGEAAQLVEQAATVCATNLQLAPRTPGWGGPPAEGVLRDFAEQFCVDVSCVSDDQRAALGSLLGPMTGSYVLGLYMVDFFPRARAALDALFGPTDPARWPSLEGGPPAEAWGASMEFMRAVALIGALDPVTAELVRLRGASQHQCRLCKSLRNRSAIAAGADDEMFASVDADRSPLSGAQRAALALADAMIWTPGRLEGSVLDEVRRELSPAEAVALVLWVTRNASNKIAVALAADAPHVTDGVEIYDLDASGEPVYGAA